jgi:hypothetical protein
MLAEALSIKLCEHYLGRLMLVVLDIYVFSLVCIEYGVVLHLSTYPLVLATDGAIPSHIYITRTRCPQRGYRFHLDRSHGIRASLFLT